MAPRTRLRPRAIVRRALGVAARRLDRPELISAFYRPARQAEHEAVGIAAVLAATLLADSTYVDVGSNRGQVLAEAVRVAPHGLHVAFEPIPGLADELAARFPGVQTRRKALAAQAGRAQFCYFTELDGWSGLRRNPEISDEQGRPELIDVEVSTLDIELQGIDPAVIKIDVEGAELQVLEGGRTVLSKRRPVLIFEHVSAAAATYDTSSQQLWALLAELGYVVFTATGDGPVSAAQLEELPQVVNWLARPVR